MNNSEMQNHPDNPITINFISNQKGENHQTSVLTNLRRYEEVFIAVAFLKVSGLEVLINPFKEFLKAGGQISLVAGQNFALTEPVALHSLRKLFGNYQSSKIYLAKTNKVNSIFHPKLFLFRKENSCCIISGSANITKGGLESNQECSLIAHCHTKEATWVQAKNYFDTLISDDNAEEATLLAIKKYETFYELQKALNKKVKSILSKNKSQLEFDYDTLLKHFRKFNNYDRESEFNGKMDNYVEAKKILNRIAREPKLTQRQFSQLLDELVSSKGHYGLWHSGSLFRLRKFVYQHLADFRELVKFISENKHKSPSLVFGGAKNIVKKINGASVNYITEIMMTYNPVDFANLNKNPITVLRRQGGVHIKASSESFNGDDYEEYCDLVKEISDKLGLRNMLEADSYFNKIYWKIKK